MSNALKVVFMFNNHQVTLKFTYLEVGIVTFLSQYILYSAKYIRLLPVFSQTFICILTYRE